MSYKPRLKEDYPNSVVSALMKKSGYKNIMQVPKLNKIVIIKLIIKNIQVIKIILPETVFY